MYESTDWRMKYREAVDRLLADEVRWNEIQNAQRLLIGRLCLAAQGRHPDLDRLLHEVQEVSHAEPDAQRIQALIPRLSQAIVALDRMPESGDAPPAMPGSDAILVALERLARMADMEPLLEELRSADTQVSDARFLARLIERLAVLAGEKKAQVLGEKRKLGKLLMDMSSRLDEIMAYLTGEAAARHAIDADTQKFSVLMTGELQQLRNNVGTAADFEELRARIEQRLDQLDAHIQDFRAREEERFRIYRERLSRMRARIAELEHETRRLHEHLQEEQRLSMIDALTGIPNRAAYDERIEQEFLRWKRFGRPVSILAWDIDRFKAINDAYGHKAGDKVLRVVGQHLASRIRSTDFVARYGGEEFVMLMVGATPQEAWAIADRIRAEIEQLGFHFYETPVRVTASCGITCFSGEDDTADAAFDRADRALYRAKQAGRNRCVIVEGNASKRD